MPSTRSPSRISYREDSGAFSTVVSMGFSNLLGFGTVPGSVGHRERPRGAGLDGVADVGQVRFLQRAQHLDHAVVADLEDVGSKHLAAARPHAPLAVDLDGAHRIP